MGCDGGTIPRRDELVKTKKKPEQKNKESELAFKWKHCALSQESLVKPFVACELGRLYNKESVIQYLIDKSQMQEVSPKFKHLRGLRDIKEVNLTENPAKRKQEAEKGAAYVDSGASDYICPVVGVEMSGKHRFCMIWTCGCVMSERALKEIKSNVCHKCGKKYDELDVLVLNPEAEDLESVKENMTRRRARAKAAKKSGKAAKEVSPQQAESSGCGSKESSSSPPTSSSSSPPSQESQDSPSTSQTNGHSSKETDQPRPSKTIGSKLKSSLNGHSSKPGKLLSSSSSQSATGSQAGVKRKHGIQNDPTTSKTFKSLFTSSNAAKNQMQPHWITYNPMYY